MTNEELFEQAEELTRAWESLKVSIDFLDAMNAITKKDASWDHYFFNSHQSSNLESNLLNIAKTMVKVSDAICPGE
ncbi:hypothetical protein LL936_08875 [Levilactobacillus brevis]|uniref:hypothetical protein n=1 Tax=Levilactobacillus brevis TaxID=1580 RepID=UPI001C1EA626|nr:hypothetical protein [Levilactobacillus brevis]MBU7540208.1 hypothetical protein [Levilactobacillus brevis]MBU7557981.1 hypothetical protein [Levilactobacillus brevis]MBU7566336.1 hypothetical protein [Levilactobacillus brevis]MCE6009456.1 hypothetical protein [Levilactobacillus brevis]MCE6013886.1 hypothetical protein [Levilactobacillus brevis]